MPVDFKKPAHVLAVHGVQMGESSDIDSDRQISALLERALSDSHVVKEFEVRGYFYEDLNDKAISFYKTIGKAITTGNPLVGAALNRVTDLVGDVVIAAKNTSTAHKIRKGLEEEILKSYRAGHQVVVIAHSLGTVYALDVVSKLIGSARYFKGDDRRTWPVQGLVTMGSPLGLGLEIGGVKFFELRELNPLAGAEYSLFPWYNYYNPLDPVVSGSILGRPVRLDGSKGPVESRYGSATRSCKWLLQGHAVVSGEQWLIAHVQYWDNPTIGDRVVDILWS